LLEPHEFRSNSDFAALLKLSKQSLIIDVFPG
jgi:hypothetical protein